MKSAAAALAFVAAQGIVLASARGPAPRLIEFIADETIAGNWWSHPRASAIYNVLSRVSESDDLLVCRLINGKITLVHRRLWPALARVAARLPPERIAQVCDVHLPSGRHETREITFADWVSADVLRDAAALSESDALAQLAPWWDAASAPVRRPRVPAR